ncbi:hypothetical protein FACS1894126_2970 [Alphaproteobacteria bacterium]|nr:hypothetical protein FACS1894126_2970 [Alphaproteobacteria bacterium]
MTLHPKNHFTMGKKTKKVNARGATTLYSPVGWLSWEACAQNYEMAKDDEQLLKAWTNTTLGIPWEEKGEAPDWGILFDRREHYRIGSIPNGGYVLRNYYRIKWTDNIINELVSLHLHGSNASSLFGHDCLLPELMCKMIVSKLKLSLGDCIRKVGRLIIA